MGTHSVTGAVVGTRVLGTRAAGKAREASAGSVGVAETPRGAVRRTFLRATGLALPPVVAHACSRLSIAPSMAVTIARAKTIPTEFQNLGSRHEAARTESSSKIVCSITVETDASSVLANSVIRAVLGAY